MGHDPYPASGKPCQLARSQSVERGTNPENACTEPHMHGKVSRSAESKETWLVVPD